MVIRPKENGGGSSLQARFITPLPQKVDPARAASSYTTNCFIYNIYKCQMNTTNHIK